MPGQHTCDIAALWDGLEPPIAGGAQSGEHQLLSEPLSAEGLRYFRVGEDHPIAIDPVFRHGDSAVEMDFETGQLGILNHGNVGGHL